MRQIRIIPVLLLDNGGLYKTINFKNPRYIGDPINAVKIFNEKEADELMLLDFRATLQNRQINFSKIAEIAGEAFMPMAYGGGIKNLDDAKKVFDCGYEKIVLNSVLFDNPSLVNDVAQIYGAQAVVGFIDFKKTLLGKIRVFARSGTVKKNASVVEWAKELEKLGVGEIVINSIDKDGTWSGYQLDILHQVSSSVNVPVVACGGASSVDDFRKAVDVGVSAVAAGSLFVYQKKGMGVLINFPSNYKLFSKDSTNAD